MIVSAGLVTMVSVFRFSRSNINVRNRWDIAVLIYAVILIPFSLITDLVVKSVSVEGGVIVYELGNWIGLIAGPGYVLMLYSIAIMIRTYRKTIDPIQQNRLLYLILGTGIMIAGSGINFTPLGQYPLDIAANGITATLFIYAILRYQLLDIRVVIRQGMLYSIPTIIIGATYFLIISLAINIFNIYTGAELFILSLLVAVLSALVAEPLRLKFQSLIDRMFFREKYDSQVMLQTVSSRASSMLDLYKITKMILAEVASTLQLPRAAFFLKDEEAGLFQLITQIGLDDFGNQTFRQGHPVVMWLSTHDVPLGKQEMEVLPQFQSLWKSERQFLNDMGAELFIPIKVQSKLVGIFTLGPKRSEQPYKSEEIITLSTVANQTAVAIENARLFTEEQSRRKEINTLYNLSNQLVATNDLDTVLRSVTQHAVESVQVTYSRILLREDNGDYYCRAIYPIRNLAIPLRLGSIEPIVAEHFYDTVLQDGKTVVLDINKPGWQPEEKQAIFINFAKTLCLCPLKGADDQVGLLILGEFSSIESEHFVPTQLRLINAIADYATSSIQRTMLHDRLEESFLQTVVSLANAMDARDSYTGDHSQRMADMASLVGKEMELPTADIETLHWAGILHDIGKIGVPDGILNKKGKLTKEEWVIMKEHPVTGAQIVEPVKYLSAVSPIIRAHHEKYDGTGYPYGLSGEDIPFGSRILAVVDAYVAIRDERVYRAARSHEEAIAELRRFSGTQFDPVIVDIFCKTIKE
jgi:putative nucleotidyltransferase with HDIG domain